MRLFLLTGPLCLGDLRIAMAKEPENIVLVHLRRLGEQMDSLREDNREIKTRLGILEQQGAFLSNRIDRIELRLDRIEKRLDVVDV